MMKKCKPILFILFNIMTILLLCGCPKANPGPDLDVSSLDYYGIDLSEDIEESGTVIPQDMETQMRMVENADVYELIRLSEKVSGEAEASLFSRLLQELEQDPVRVVEDIERSNLSEESLYNLTARLNSELSRSQPDAAVLESMKNASEELDSDKAKGILRKILGGYN